MATDATDTPNPLEVLKQYISWGSDPKTSQALRQRIALQMMTGKTKAYPKTIGEGLSAVGDSLGDIGLARMLERSDLGAQNAAGGARLPSEGAQTSEVQPSATSRDAMAYAPADERVPAETQQPPPADAPGNVMSTAPSQQPASVLAAATPAGLGGAGPAMTPPQTASLLNPRSTLGGTAPRIPGDLVPAAPPDPQTRDRIAATLNGQTPQEVAQPNPTLAGAQQPSPISTTAPGGPQPDQRVAQLALTNPRTVSDIAPAPPVPSQLRTPQQPTPVPGYVPPEPGPVRAAPIVPLSQIGKEAAAWLQANQGNPYAANSRIGVIYQNEIAKQKLQQDQANELYKAQIGTAETLRIERQKAMMDQAKRIADEAHTREQIQASRLQETEGKMVRNPDGSYSPPVITGVDPNSMPNVKLTEPQQKALLYHGWASIAQENLEGKEKLIAEGLKQEALGKIPFAGNKMLSAQYRQAKTAENQFVQAFLRSTSGANYGAAELQQHLDTLLPRYGDDAKTLADKHTQRENFIASMYGALGPGRAVADYNSKVRQEKQSARDAQVDAEMKGADKVVGKVYIDPQTKNRRAWNGRRWEDL